MNCRACGAGVTSFFSLGQMPLVNAFLHPADIAHEITYPLEVGFCPQCYLVQLLHTISPDVLFRDYAYVSAASSTFVAHCQELADYFEKRFQLDDKSFILELASNDGTFLKPFQKKGMTVLGVDPALNIARLANTEHIPTLPEFFTRSLAEHTLRNTYGAADLVYGANVLAHVPEVTDFLEGVALVLAPQGVAVFEFPYIQGLFEGKFDTIYHEHVFYYSLLALVTLFQRVGLELFDVEMTALQGGSLLIFASHPGVFSVTGRVTDLLEQEKSLGWDSLSAYQKIEHQAQTVRDVFGDLLRTLREQGKTIAAYGAAAKGVVLLNYMKVDSTSLQFVADRSPFKQGMYMPGVHVPVLPPEAVLERNPDYLVILPWNIAEEIMGQMSEYEKRGGQFIIPVPQVTVPSRQAV